MTQPDFSVSNESIVRNAIQEMIMNHELEPGDKLPSEADEQFVHVDDAWFDPIRELGQ
ncbi:hypothetical protein J4760_00325 [Salinicoccus sp. ID82-1]|uniref:hypothetical protein n=1 Tax=Salinicoccus sp. ID82-1 TaxID=2820269 RepID=UPI001F19D601|nr:hypothetical protein [Salinicoccus sp. ID82-1]MCG1008486.1 hypothetical protein [Salinicoccus sp. ID82-1]